MIRARSAIVRSSASGAGADEGVVDDAAGVGDLARSGGAATSASAAGGRAIGTTVGRGAAPGAEAGARPAPRARPLRPGRARFFWVGVALVALVAAGALWFDARRVQQALRTDVAQRLAGVEASISATAKAQTQLATDL